MLLGLPDNIHEEKPSFLQLKKHITDGGTDGPTDGRTDPFTEMRGRILKGSKAANRPFTRLFSKNLYNSEKKALDFLSKCIRSKKI